MSEVKRYAYKLSGVSQLSGFLLEVIEYSGDGLPYVLASDYDQLKADYAEIESALVTKNHEAHDLEIDNRQLKADNERLNTRLVNQGGWLTKLRDTESERDTLRKQLDETNEALGRKNARIAEFAERHLKDFAELERLDKQLDEARELFEYIKSDCTLSMLHRIDAWLEATKP